MLHLEPGIHEPGETPGLLPPLYQAITHAYRLEVEFPETIDKRRQWELKVVDANGKELKNVEVLYPRLLLPLSED